MNEIDKFPDITNHCINSAAAVRFGITKEVNVDDFYVLRQAEVSAASYSREVATYKLDIEICDRNYIKWQRRIDVLNHRQALCQKKFLGWLFKAVLGIKNWFYKLLRLPHEEDELFALEMNVRRYYSDRPRLDREMRDSQMQLEAALKEKAAFYERNPEFVGKTYEEIQEELTERALLNRIAMSVAAHVLGGQFGAAAAAMLELSSEQLNYVIRREHELRAKLEGYQFNGAIYQILQEVKPEDREQFVLTAAQLARPYTVASSDRMEAHELQQLQMLIQQNVGSNGVIISESKASEKFNSARIHNRKEWEQFLCDPDEFRHQTQIQKDEE
jgi:hypothetical protein